GFGWGPAMVYLLPLPFGWMVARRVLRRGARSLLRRLSNSYGIACLPLALLWMAAGGFAFCFTVTFLQGLLSWFMTPAPTLLLEMYLDRPTGVEAAISSAIAASVCWPGLLLFRPRE